MEYVISTSDDNLELVMYKEDDFRLKSKTYKEKGTFKKLRSLKGKINNKEQGVFIADDGKKYLVFDDWKVSRPTDVEKYLIEELLKQQL